MEDTHEIITAVGGARRQGTGGPLGFRLPIFPTLECCFCNKKKKNQKSRPPFPAHLGKAPRTCRRALGDPAARGKGTVAVNQQNGHVPRRSAENDTFPRSLKQILTNFDSSAIRTLAYNLSSSTPIISGLQLYESISISINQMI